MLYLIAVALFGVSYAQDQNYTFTGGSFNYRIIIYGDVAVGDTAIEIITFGEDPETPLSIIGFVHAGLDSDGTLHLIRTNNDYLLGSEESFEISTAISEPISFGGVLGKPFNVDLDVQIDSGNKLNITLVNAGAFEASTE